MSESKPNRIVILEAIQAGGATRESLLKLTGITTASFGTNLAYLRMMGHFPVLNEDKTYKIVTKDEYDALKANRPAAKPKVTRSFEERQAMAAKRVSTCIKAAEAAGDRFEKDPESEILGLRAQRASIELQIAQWEFNNLEAGTVEEPEVGEVAETDPEEM